MLSSLEGLSLGEYSLQLHWGGNNRYGARYFRLFLQDSQGRQGQPEVVAGLASEGALPSYNWIEVTFSSPQVSFGPVMVDLEERNLFRSLFHHLAQLIPPGGHLMVEYESPQWQSSRHALRAGLPPILTPLGELLSDIGCEDGFKDLHFAEGGREGAPKLIGYKALTPAQAQQARERIARELMTFLLQAHSPTPLTEKARALLLRWGYRDEGRKGKEADHGPGR